MVRIIMAVFALACILMIAGYEFKAPSLILAGLVLYGLVVIVCSNIVQRYFR